MAAAVAGAPSSWTPCVPQTTGIPHPDVMQGAQPLVLIV